MLKQRHRCDRGSVSVELAILAPATMIVLLLIVQVVLWANATHTAQAAAGAALAAARAETGSAAAGQGAAENAITHYSDGPLTEPSVSVSRGSETVSVTVTGSAQSVLPFFDFPVESSLTGPVEAFRPDTGAP